MSATTSAVPAFPMPSRPTRTATPAPSPVQAPGSSWSQIRAELHAIRESDDADLRPPSPPRPTH